MIELYKDFPSNQPLFKYKANQRPLLADFFIVFVNGMLLGAIIMTLVLG